jgi:hypothetical protein
VSDELEEIGGTITLWCSNAECTSYDTEHKLLDKRRVDSNIDNGYCAATVVSWLHCWGMSRREMCVRLFLKASPPQPRATRSPSVIRCDVMSQRHALRCWLRGPPPVHSFQHGPTFSTHFRCPVRCEQGSYSSHIPTATTSHQPG